LLPSFDQKMARKKMRRNRAMVPRALGVAGPPQYRSICTFRKKFRFYASAACVSGTFNEGQMLSVPGTMCTVTNSTVVSMQVSVKIHSVEIWGIGAATANGNVVSFRPFGSAASAANNLAVMEAVSDTTTSVAYVPHVKYVPSKGSRLAFWLSADNSGADTLFAIDCPAGSVIEFDLEFQHGMPAAVGSFTTAISTGTVGVMYWLGMNAASGTGQIYPQDLATTI